MPRPKGSPNKVTAAAKEQLQNLIDEVVNSIAVTYDHIPKNKTVSVLITIWTT